MSQVLVSPDETKEYLKQSLLLQLWLSAEGVPEIRLQALLSQVTESKQRLMLQASKRTSTVSRAGE